MFIITYKGCDNAYFSIVRMQYFFFTSDSIDISCLVYSSFHVNKITYLLFNGDSLQTSDTILHWQNIE